MLSVLIPTYNCQCVLLVEELLRQMADFQIDAEVVVIDDASDNADTLAANAAIAALPHCRYIVLPERISIAQMRNRLLQEATAEWALCLDADVFPVNADFLKRYSDALAKAKIVCGGLAYRSGNEQNVNPLRYKYGITHEALSLKEREANAYQSFKTSNYLIYKPLATSIGFDESFGGYGHEDTLFGKLLQQTGEPILHIENPVYHNDTDTAEQFLAKTRQGIANLIDHSEPLQGYSRLLHAYSKLRRWHLANFISLFFPVLHRPFERNLLDKHPSMHIFSWYKLLYICHLSRKKNN